MSATSERDLLSRLLKQSILTMCREAVTYTAQLDVDGLICLTVDNQSQHIVKIHELFRKNSASVGSGSSTSSSGGGTISSTEAVQMEQKPVIHEGNPGRNTANTRRNSSHENTNIHESRNVERGRGSIVPEVVNVTGKNQTNIDGVNVEPVDPSIPDVKVEAEELKTEPELLNNDVIKTEPSDAYSTDGAAGAAGSSSNSGSNAGNGEGNTSAAAFMENVNSGTQKFSISQQKNIPCKKCGEVLDDVVSLENHTMQAHGHFTCLICLATFTSRNNMKRHVRLHTGIKPYSCYKCSESFARNDDYKRHLLRHSFQKPFRCAICKTGYSDRSCVKNHMIKEHQSKIFHICPQCGESFVDAQRFQQHKKSHPEFQDYRCTLCSFTGSNALMYNKHMLTHGPQKTYKCSHCGISFKDPFMYTSHLKKHKGDDLVQAFQCCFCDMQLQSYEQFQRHEHSHIQAKQHTCDICKKQFRYPSNLREHLLIHMSKDDSKASDQDNKNEKDYVAANIAASTSTIIDSSEVIDVDTEENNNIIPAKTETLEDISNAVNCDESNDYWCTECHQGFGTEDHLTEHIAKTHEQPQLNTDRQAQKDNATKIKDEPDFLTSRGEAQHAGITMKRNVNDDSKASNKNLNSTGFKTPHIRLKSDHFDFDTKTITGVPFPKRARMFDEETVIDSMPRIKASDDSKPVTPRAAAFDQETVVDAHDDYQKDVLVGSDDNRRFRNATGRASVLFDQETIVDAKDEYQKYIDMEQENKFSRTSYAAHARTYDTETQGNISNISPQRPDFPVSDKNKPVSSALFGSIFKKHTAPDPLRNGGDTKQEIGAQNKQTLRKSDEDIVNESMKKVRALQSKFGIYSNFSKSLDSKSNDKVERSKKYEEDAISERKHVSTGRAGTAEKIVHLSPSENRVWVKNKAESTTATSGSGQLKTSLKIELKSESLDESYSTLARALKSMSSGTNKSGATKTTTNGLDQGDFTIKTESNDDSLSPTGQYSKTSVLGMDTEFSSAPNRSSPTTLNLKVRNPGFEKVVTPEVLFSTKSPFTCKVCEETFLDFDSFDQHGVTVHRRYICSYCGKAFTSRPNRERHVRYHTGEKPYKCDLCPVSFFRGDDLKYHRTTKHADVRPFTCGMCQSSFGLAKELEKHLKIYPDHRS